MRPSFNTTGPCIPGEHYMLPPERRLGRVLELIEDRKYFTLQTEVEALDQVTRYLDHAGLAEGWLILFDLRKELAWSEKLSLRELTHAGKRVRVVGC